MKCNYCKKEAKWTENSVIYGKRYGKSYMIWWCKDCDAYVGCHKNTKDAKGSLANKELRKWRIKAHAVIDSLWKSKKYSRKEVYMRLTDAFGKDVHIGTADIKDCKDIIKTAELVFKGNLFSRVV